MSIYVPIYLPTQHSVDLLGLWLMAPVTTLRDRITSKLGGDVSVLEKQLRMLKGTIDWWPIDTSGSIEDSVEDSVEEIINRISNR